MKEEFSTDDISRVSWFSVGMVHDTIRYCFQFLDIPNLVHSASLVCHQWRKRTLDDALWEALFFRDAVTILHDSLFRVIDDPSSDVVLAKAARVHSYTNRPTRLKKVKWSLVHPRCSEGLYTSLDAAVRGKDLLGVVSLVECRKRVQEESACVGG